MCSEVHFDERQILQELGKLIDLHSFIFSNLFSGSILALSTTT